MTIPLYRRTRENYRHGSRDLLSYSVEFVGRRQRNFEYGKTTPRLSNRLGVNYDGTMPTIVLACDENWFALYAVWDIRY